MDNIIDASGPDVNGVILWLIPTAIANEENPRIVVWTDSMAGVSGIAALSARARQYDANGTPLGPPLILPNQDVPSGLANIATDGIDYYCTCPSLQDKIYLNCSIQIFILNGLKLTIIIEINAEVG